MTTNTLQSAPPIPPSEKPHGHSIGFVLDKSYYLPGQRVQGQVQANLDHDTSVRSLNVQFQGVESVRIVVGAGKSRRVYTSSRDMANAGLQLLPGATVREGTTTYPFTFDIPQDALPSYVGRFAHVSWKLSTKADIPWRSDLDKELFLLVLNTFPSQAMPVAAESLEAKPKIRLSLSSNLYQPGETIEGKLALLELGSLRSVRIQLSIDERSTGKGTLMGVTGDTVTNNLPVGDQLVYSREDLEAAGEVAFRIPLSAEAPCSYTGSFSSILWNIFATLDIPHGEDVHLGLPFTVAMRPPQQVTVESAAALPPRPETPAPVQTIAPSPGSEGQDPESMILEILADGSPEDLISISNKLQEKTRNFLNINQVKDLCEKLVAMGKLERTGQGEFMAQYSLKW